MKMRPLFFWVIGVAIMFSAIPAWAADFDGDGRSDLFLIEPDHPDPNFTTSIMANWYEASSDEDIQLVKTPVMEDAAAAVIGNVDNDNNSDLVIASRGSEKGMHWYESNGLDNEMDLVLDSYEAMAFRFSIDADQYRSGFFFGRYGDEDRIYHCGGYDKGDNPSDCTGNLDSSCYVAFDHSSDFVTYKMEYDFPSHTGSLYYWNGSNWVFLLTNPGDYSSWWGGSLRLHMGDADRFTGGQFTLDYLEWTSDGEAAQRWDCDVLPEDYNGGASFYVMGYVDHPNDAAYTMVDLGSGNSGFQSHTDTLLAGGYLQTKRNVITDNKSVTLEFRMKTEAFIDRTANVKSLGIGDFDGDEYGDIFHVGMDDNVHWFEYISPGELVWRGRINENSSTCVAVGDYDSLGGNDILVGRFQGLIWYESNGNNTWNYVQSAYWPSLINMRSICMGDFDGNDKPDVLFVHDAVEIPSGMESNIGILEWREYDPNSSIFPPVWIDMVRWETNFASVALGDVDGDGRNELIATKEDGSVKYFSFLKYTPDGSTKKKMGEKLIVPFGHAYNYPSAVAVVSADSCDGGVFDADLDGDCQVNAEDLAEFSLGWAGSCMYPGENYRGAHPAGDIDYNCLVDFNDFALFASQWLKCSDLQQAGCEAAQ